MIALVLICFFYTGLFVKASEYITYSVSAEEAELGPQYGYGLTIDKQWLRVMDPEELDYFYPVMLAKDFGVPLDEEEPLYANLVAAEPLNACTKLTSTDRFLYKNKFVLAIRGSCSFVEKSLNIQKAGGRVAIIYDNDPEAQVLISMGDDDTKQGKDVAITAYAMLHDDGKAIHEEMLYQKQRLTSRVRNSINANQPSSSSPTQDGPGRSPTPANTRQTGPPKQGLNNKLETVSKEAQEIDDNFNLDSTLENDLKVQSQKNKEQAQKENVLNQKKIEMELASMFSCMAPLNQTKAYLMQPPWRVWHDEL